MKIGSMCWRCQHMIANGRSSALTCSAFAEGIPKAIISGDFDHRLPYESDGGIRFLPLSSDSTNAVNTSYGTTPDPERPQKRAALRELDDRLPG